MATRHVHHAVFVLMRTALILIFLAACLPLEAQWRQDPTTGSSTYKVQDRTTLQGQVATTTDFGVRLVEPEKSARQRKAVLEVFVDGLELVDPRTAKAPVAYQGHVVYKLDGGPEQRTASRRSVLDNLSPGDHTITVYLASNDGHAISPLHELKLRIPK